MPIESGIKAPNFRTVDQNKEARSLSDYRGRPVVLYFYPEDDTPGCTKEACNFRDDYLLYKEVGAVILGVSPDGADSHAKFVEKFTLPFTLLADEDRAIAEAYGVWGEKTYLGKKYMGILRTTFLIDSEGQIAQVFEGVKPDVHSQEVLAAIKALQD